MENLIYNGLNLVVQHPVIAIGSVGLVGAYALRNRPKALLIVTMTTAILAALSYESTQHFLVQKLTASAFEKPDMCTHSSNMFGRRVIQEMVDGAFNGYESVTACCEKGFAECCSLQNRITQCLGDAPWGCVAQNLLDSMSVVVKIAMERVKTSCNAGDWTSCLLRSYYPQCFDETEVFHVVSKTFAKPAQLLLEFRNGALAELPIINELSKGVMNHLKFTFGR